MLRLSLALSSIVSYPAKRQQTDAVDVFPIPGGPNNRAARAFSVFFSPELPSKCGIPETRTTFKHNIIPILKPVIEFVDGPLITHNIFQLLWSIFGCKECFIHSRLCLFSDS